MPEIVDRIGMPQVTEFITGKLGRYNTLEIDWIKLLRLNGKKSMSGRCRKPRRKSPRSKVFVSGYQLRASINLSPGSFPTTARQPAWVRCFEGEHGWMRSEGVWTFHNAEEAAVYVLAHEAAHFLMLTNQIELEDLEENANWVADKWTDEFYGYGWFKNAFAWDTPDQIPF